MHPAPANQSEARPVLLHVFSTFAVGGPQTRFAQIANALGRKYRHLIVSMDSRHDARVLLDSHVDYEILKPCDGRMSFPRRVSGYRQMLHEIRPDTLITYNWGAIEWAIANLDGSYRHLHIEDGFGPEESEKQLRRRVLTRQIALRGHSQIIVPSLGLRNIALTNWRIASDRLFHVPNGVEWQRFQRNSEPAAMTIDLPRDRLVIGTVAALRAEKNLERLLRAFRKVSDTQSCHLLVVGDGSQRPALEALSRELAIADQVTFAGHFDRPETIIGQFHIFGLSSDTEQMPYSILEAMAQALPIAGVDVGDVKAMVTDENKPFIVSKDIGELGEALGRLASDGTLRERIGKANLSKVQSTYGIESMINSYDMLFYPNGVSAMQSSNSAE